MAKTEQLQNAETAFKWIIQILKKLHIPYQIAGGLAARAYGASRPLADIDIDIPEEYFASLSPKVRAHIVFGPDHYKDDFWDIYLLTLNYKGQAIDLCGIHKTKIFNKKLGKWQKITTDFSKNEKKKVLDLLVPVISRKELIAYKTVLNREVDQIDVKQINSSAIERAIKEAKRRIIQ